MWIGSRDGGSFVKDLYIVKRVWIADETKTWLKTGGGRIYVCAPRLPIPKMSVSLRDEGVIIPTCYRYLGMVQAVS